MYCQLLEQSVAGLRNETKVSPLDTIVDIGLSGTVPKGWIPSDARRMEAYRRIGQADTIEALAKVTADLESAYGSAPATTKSLPAAPEPSVLKIVSALSCTVPL